MKKKPKPLTARKREPDARKIAQMVVDQEYLFADLLTRLKMYDVAVAAILADRKRRKKVPRG